MKPGDKYKIKDHGHMKVLVVLSEEEVIKNLNETYIRIYKNKPYVFVYDIISKLTKAMHKDILIKEGSKLD